MVNDIFFNYLCILCIIKMFIFIFKIVLNDVYYRKEIFEIGNWMVMKVFNISDLRLGSL